MSHLISHLVDSRELTFPKGFDEAENLKWLYDEVKDIVSKHPVSVICVRRAETSVRRSNPLEARFSHENAAVSMELLSAGSLEDAARGGTFPLTRAKMMMIDVLRGLHHAHELGIPHRDIRPGNILIGPAGEGKLSDFGLAMLNVTDLDVTQLQDYQYLLHLAPEVRSLQDFSALTDIYACGVTLFRRRKNFVSSRRGYSRAVR